MEITVRDFLGASFNHGDYIKIINMADGIDKTIWEGKFETSDNQIQLYIYNSKVIKWGICNNGIILYINA